jgi:hypothetical protein
MVKTFVQRGAIAVIKTIRGIFIVKQILNFSLPEEGLAGRRRPNGKIFDRRDFTSSVPSGVKARCINLCAVAPLQ